MVVTSFKQKPTFDDGDIVTCVHTSAPTYYDIERRVNRLRSQRITSRNIAIAIKTLLYVNDVNAEVTLTLILFNGELCWTLTEWLKKL